MNWFTNLSTRAKLFAGFGVMWLLMIVVISLAYWNMSGLAQSEKEIHEVGMVKLLGLQKLRTDQNYNRGQILAMMLTTKKTEQDAMARRISARSAEMDEILRQLASLDPDAQNRSQLSEIKNTMVDYRKTREQQISLIRQGKIEEAKQMGVGIQDTRYERIRSIEADLGQREKNSLTERTKLDAQRATETVRLFVFFGVLASFLSLAMILLLNHTIAKPLATISGVAAQISDGNLTVDVSSERRRDEVGVLAQTFGDMIRNLRRSTSEISEAISQLGAAASEIMTATTQVASGTAETASAISETTSTVEEVRQAAQLSNEKAQDVSKSAQDVVQVSQDGERAVEEAAEGMQHIKGEMESIAKTVVFLSEQGQSIGGIIATVTDLADQSNLLAVNAAIEAAKAGEHGKGFAVVAQEIKSLAEQSKQATSQVRTILSDIQRATSAAVMATEQGSKAVDAGIKQSDQAGDTIRTLTQGTTDSAQAATQIAVSSQQQVVGMDQVGVAMENINQAGTETAASMKQVETAAQNLSELGQNLKRLVEGNKT